MCSDVYFCLIYSLGNVNLEQKFYSIISEFENITEKFVLAIRFAFYFCTSVVPNITSFRLNFVSFQARYLISKKEILKVMIT